MLNFLKVVRYLVFFVFIISNAIVTSVAVWNLTIVEGTMRFSATAMATASYLIAVAAMGLLLIFPIVFLEITGKRSLGMVWFELTWTGLFGMMTLIGASLITSLSSREFCIPPPIVKNNIIISPVLASSCSSAKVLGVFTWMPATFLLAYMTLLSILALVHSKEDPSIWKCPVQDLPVDEILGEVRRNSIVSSLHIRKTPVIHAPKPRYIIPPLLDCRSARNSAYESQPPALPPKTTPAKESSWYQPSRGPYTSTAFYTSSVQKAFGDGSRMPALPPPVQSGKRRQGQTSPPPLGDWPRLDATSRPRTKRAPRTVPQAEAQGPRTRDSSTAIPRHSSRRTAPSSTTAVPFVERPTVPHRTSSSRTRPPGSGHSGSVDHGPSSFSDHRPPPLDLSKISTHRTRSERSRARAGR